jgi:hypothetical protein
MEALRYIGVASTLIGLLMLIAAAAYVVLENTQIQHALDGELADLPGLRNEVARKRTWQGERQASRATRQT